MSIIHMSLSVPTPPPLLSSAKAITGGTIPAGSLFLTKTLSNLCLTKTGTIPFKTTTIRMGGGPRTYPGGVSKWQWKRMQNSKAKQLLKARLTRERQIYEMRKRAELKAAVSELERPWEKVEKPLNLFSVSADEQLKVLADRFQKPGGLDLWSERDGPEIFRTDNGLPSARFIPKGVVHSIKPYGKIANSSLESQELDSLSMEEDIVPVPVSENAGKMSVQRKGGYKNSRIGNSGLDVGVNHSPFRHKRLEGFAREDKNGRASGKIRTRGSRGTYRSNSEGVNFGEDRFNNRNSGKNGRQGAIDGEIRTNSYDKREMMNSDMFHMSLQDDGGYGFEFEV